MFPGNGDAQRVKQAGADRFGSDCPMAGRLIGHALDKDADAAEHPISMARFAYGIPARGRPLALPG